MKHSKIFTAVSIISAIFILLASDAISQRFGNKDGKGKANPEVMGIFSDLHQQLKDYKDNNIHPQMLEWKNQIDNALSAEDLNELNDLRAKASQIHEGFRSKRQMNMQKGMGQGKGHIDRKKMRSQFREQRDQMREFADQLEPIKDEYEDIIDRIEDEFEAKRDKWEDDIREIHERWEEKNEAKLEEISKSRQGKRAHRGMRARHMQRLDLTSSRGMDRFLLWDGTKHEGPEFGKNFRNRSESGGSGHNLKAYPNPASQSTTVEFYLRNDCDVKLTLTDNNGNVIETIHEGSLKSGNHSFDYDGVSSLTNGQYFMKLETQGKVFTEKLIVNK